MYIGLYIKYFLFLSDFNNYGIFSTDLGKIIQTRFIKIHPVAEHLFHAETQTDGRTDRKNDANSPFSQFIFRY